jgi:hypothetical protein
MMEKPEFNVAERYSEIICLMWTTFLYSSLVPIIFIFSILQISLTYWADKYNILRK